MRLWVRRFDCFVKWSAPRRQKCQPCDRAASFFKVYNSSASEIREPQVKYVVLELPEHGGSIHFLEESLLSPYNTTLTCARLQFLMLRKQQAN